MRFSAKLFPAGMSWALALVLSALSGSTIQADVIGYWTLDDATATTAAATIGPDGTYENFSDTDLGKSGSTLDPTGYSVQFPDTASPYERINLGTSGGIVSGQAALTMAMWVKFDNLAQDGTIASIGAFGGSSPLIFWRDENDGTVDDTLAVLVGGARTKGTSGILNDTAWHHVAFTFQGGTGNGLTLYVDGNHIITGGSTTPATIAASATDPLTLGNASNSPSTSKQFEGLMDNVGIWDAALPGDTIKALYSGTLENGKTYSQLIGANDFTLASGTATLNGPNYYTGVTKVEGGILNISDANALGTTDGGLEVADGARVQLSGNITISGETATIAGSGGHVFGSLHSASGDNTWDGPVLLSKSGTRLGAYGPGSVLRVTGVIDDGANSYTLAVRNADSGGKVVLSGANTYGGSTDVVVGLLQIDGADDRLPTGTVLRIGNGSNVASATFDLNGYNQQIAGLADLGSWMSQVVTNDAATAATLTIDNASNYTFNGDITGNLAIEKRGAGRQTLGGTNTYTGDTLVSEGIFDLDTTGTLSFVIEAAGVNNLVYDDAGTDATLLLDGAFAFDLSGASTTLHDSWEIVDLDSFGSVTFGGTFSVTGFFDEGGGLWAGSSGLANYQFSEGSGMLTVIPEPSGLALAGLLLLGLLIRRRRRR